MGGRRWKKKNKRNDWRRGKWQMVEDEVVEEEQKG